MEKFIQFILTLFGNKPSVNMENPVNENLKTYPLGAHEDVPDVRRIPLALVQAVNPLPYDLEFDTDLSMFEPYYQYMGTCVEETLTLMTAYFSWREDKIVRKFSRQFGYALTRRYSGMVDPSLEGLYPSDAAKVACVVGFIPDLPDTPEFQSHSQYIAYNPSKEQFSLANTYRTGGVAYPAHDFESIRKAIHENGVVAGQVWIDWARIDFDGTIHPPRGPQYIAGTHEVLFKGSVMRNGKRTIKYRTSWGKAFGTYGEGFIYEDEFDRVFIDALVLKNIPDDLIQRAKNTQFIFLTTLKKGSVGEAVFELQKRLVEYGLLTGKIDGQFGTITENAVKEYQKLKGLVADGVIGQKGRDMLNADMGVKGKTKSKLDLWCEAIQAREGWAGPGTKMGGSRGTPSFRNNNPGNIRKPYSNKVIGYDASNFAIFPDYATGYMELRRFLQNAATGVSKIYRPSMTLYQFYAKYAPKEDNNDPVSYAEEVAKKIGVSPMTLIQDLV